MPCSSYCASDTFSANHRMKAFFILVIDFYSYLLWGFFGMIFSQCQIVVGVVNGLALSDVTFTSALVMSLI